MDKIFSSRRNVIILLFATILFFLPIILFLKNQQKRLNDLSQINLQKVELIIPSNKLQHGVNKVTVDDSTMIYLLIDHNGNSMVVIKN